MDVAEFILIFVGLLSFVRASDIPNSCVNPANTAERESQDFPYIGCYESACFKENTSLTISSINECMRACKNESTTFAAVEFGDTCYCGEFNCIDQSDTKRCDVKCGIPCQGEVSRDVSPKFCGGRGFIQVYQDLSTVTVTATQGPSIHIAIQIVIPVVILVVIFLIIIIAGILIYHRLKHAGESTIRVVDRANEQHRDRGILDSSLLGATSLSINAMPTSHRMHCASGTNPSMKNPLETLVGEVLYEDPDKKVSSATTADSELSHEYLVPFQAVPLKNSSLDHDHDYNYPDMPDVGLVQAPVSARSTGEEGYIVMDRDPQGRTTAGSKVYYSSRIPKSQGGMGSSEIPGGEGYNSTRIPKPVSQEDDRGGSVKNPDSHVYYSADSVNTRDDKEDDGYIILDEN